MKSDKTINHIAFIMDGNGRWAANRHLPRNTGHKEGIKAMIRIADACHKLSVPYVSFYAFSTENKNRPIGEVKGLVSLMEDNFSRLAEELKSNNIRLNVMGDITYFGGKVQKIIEDGVEKTRHLSGGVVNIALNYGGRDELCRAAELYKNSSDNAS